RGGSLFVGTHPYPRRTTAARESPAGPRPALLPLHVEAELDGLTLKRQTGRPAGHIGGTSPRDLPGSAESCRDLSRRSTHMYGTFPKVKEVSPKAPAYGPTPPRPTLCPACPHSVSAGAAQATGAYRRTRVGGAGGRIAPDQRSDIGGPGGATWRRR